MIVCIQPKKHEIVAAVLQRKRFLLIGEAPDGAVFRLSGPWQAICRHRESIKSKNWKFRIYITDLKKETVTFTNPIHIKIEEG